MKRLWFIVLPLMVSLAMTACGNSYDDDIDSVVDLESEELEKDSVKTHLDKVERDELEVVNIYNDGEYIELLYVVRGHSDTSNPVYNCDKDRDEYVSYSNA